jgi:hypothetical protein
VARADAHIRDWLKALGVLVSPAMSSEEASARIDALTPHLAAEFPPGVFCRVSLTHTARLCRFFPNFAELCDALAPWWREHRPSPPPLPAPAPIRQRDEPSEEERAHVVRLTAETIAALRAQAVSDAPAKPTTRVLSPKQLTQAYRQAGARPPRAFDA